MSFSSSRYPCWLAVSAIAFDETTLNDGNRMAFDFLLIFGSFRPFQVLGAIFTEFFLMLLTAA